jgi:hypothetical protein
MGDLAELAKYIGGAGVGGGFVIGVIFAVKYLRNGKGAEGTDTRGPLQPVAATPECPGLSYFEEGKVHDIRQEEAFRSMIQSWDKVAVALDEQTRAITKTGEKHADALVKVAEVLTKRRD